MYSVFTVPNIDGFGICCPWQLYLLCYFIYKFSLFRHFDCEPKQENMNDWRLLLCVNLIWEQRSLTWERDLVHSCTVKMQNANP